MGGSGYSGSANLASPGSNPSAMEGVQEEVRGMSVQSGGILGVFGHGPPSFRTPPQTDPYLFHGGRSTLAFDGHSPPDPIREWVLSESEAQMPPYAADSPQLYSTSGPLVYASTSHGGPRLLDPIAFFAVGAHTRPTTQGELFHVARVTSLRPILYSSSSGPELWPSLPPTYATATATLDLLSSNTKLSAR